MLVRSPTLTNRLSSVMVNGSRPGEPHRRRDARGRSRRCLPSTARGDRGDVVGRGAAAAADQVDEAGLGELADDRGGLVGRLVVLAERVGQAGVGVAGDEGVGDPRHLGDVGPHLLGAERAVEADRERADVPDRVPERLGHLAGQGAAGGVGDGAGDDHRPAPAALLEQRLDREDRGLGVEGVEDRLDEEQVRRRRRRRPLAASRYAATSWSKVTLRAPGSLTSGEIDAVRVVGPSAPATYRGLSGVRAVTSSATRAGQPRRLEVELVGELLHAVVGQRDRVGVEGVGLDDVGAGLEVLAVDRRR